MIEWTDRDGQRVVVTDDSIIIYGKPGMTRTDGAVSISAEIPADVSLAPSPDCICPVGWGKVVAEDCPRHNPRPRHTFSGVGHQGIGKAPDA